MFPKAVPAPKEWRIPQTGSVKNNKLAGYFRVLVRELTLQNHSHAGTQKNH